MMERRDVDSGSGVKVGRKAWLRDRGEESKERRQRDYTG